MGSCIQNTHSSCIQSTHSSPVFCAHHILDNFYAAYFILVRKFKEVLQNYYCYFIGGRFMKSPLVIIAGTLLI